MNFLFRCFGFSEPLEKIIRKKDVQILWRSVESLIRDGNVLRVKLPTQVQLYRFSCITSLNCGGNNIRNLPELPPRLISLECYTNHLVLLPDLPDTLKTLKCPYNKIRYLPKLPSGLEHLDAAGNLLRKIPKLPKGLKTLEVNNNNLKNLPKLPKTLRVCEVSHNRLKILRELPPEMTTLCVQSNFLTVLPKLPSELRYLDVDDNLLEAISELPNGLMNFYCFRNPLKFFPPIRPGKGKMLAVPEYLRYLTFRENYTHLSKLHQQGKALVNFLLLEDNLAGTSLDFIVAEFSELLPDRSSLFS